MKKTRVYQYDGCDSCRKALKFLDARGVDYERVPIVDQPPTVSELRRMLELQGGELRKLFNTSGQLYREMGMGEKLPKLSKDEALALLAKHGKLVKRPFVIAGARGLLGFKEAEWKEAF